MTDQAFGICIGDIVHFQLSSTEARAINQELLVAHLQDGGSPNDAPVVYVGEDLALLVTSTSVEEEEFLDNEEIIYESPSTPRASFLSEFYIRYVSGHLFIDGPVKLFVRHVPQGMGFGHWHHRPDDGCARARD